MTFPLALPKTPKLAFNSDGNFKILQLADLHFTNEEGKCRDIPVDASFGCNNLVLSVEEAD